MDNTTTKEQIDQFNDILHAQGDDEDVNDDEDIDFDYFFTDFDKNEEEPESNNIPWLQSALAAANTATTSKKRTPLTPTTPTAATALKKFKEQDLPKYLSRNIKFFEESIMPLVVEIVTVSQDTTMTMDILLEEFRQLAYLEHQLQITYLDIELWTVYLQSGTGKLNVGFGTGENEVDERSLLQQLQYPQPISPCIWLDKLKPIIMDDPDVSAADKANLNNSICLTYVNRMLTQFRTEYLAYETQIKEKQQVLQANLNKEIEQMIHTLVMDYGTALYAIVNEGYIAAVRFTFKEQMIDSEFEREDKMRLCIQAFRTVVKSKTAAERANIEVKMLKERVVHQQIAPILGSFQISTPADMQTIQDDTTRQCLTYQYEQLLQRTKSELIVIHIRIAEAKANELLKQFDNDQKEFFQKLRASYSESSMKKTLANLMNSRLNVIEQRLQTLLNLKVRFFVKAPTVNKF